MESAAHRSVRADANPTYELRRFYERSAPGAARRSAFASRRSKKTASSVCGMVWRFAQPGLRLAGPCGMGVAAPYTPSDFPPAFMGTRGGAVFGLDPWAKSVGRGARADWPAWTILPALPEPEIAVVANRCEADVSNPSESDAYRCNARAKPVAIRNTESFARFAAA